MTAKEYLKSIRYLDHSINAKQAELAGLQRDAENLRAVTYDTDKVQGNHVPDPMQIVDKIVALQEEINAEIDKLVDRKREARTKIAKVCNGKFVTLLTDIYINGDTLEGTAEKLGVNYRTVCRWYGQALQIFRKENNMT
jgi:hypothetical protein